MTVDRVTAAPDAASINPTIFAAILQQNSENLRSIKSQRIWFLQTFAVIATGTQSLLLGIRAEPVLQVGLNLSMTAVAAMGLLISLRLKAELEECLEKVRALVAQAQVEEFMALERSQGDLSRYPKFRWMFPSFYAVAITFFGVQSVHNLTVAMTAR